jgi:hypothetical protein
MLRQHALNHRESVMHGTGIENCPKQYWAKGILFAQPLTAPSEAKPRSSRPTSPATHPARGSTILASFRIRFPQVRVGAVLAPGGYDSHNHLLIRWLYCQHAEMTRGIHEGKRVSWHVALQRKSNHARSSMASNCSDQCGSCNNETRLSVIRLKT